MIIPRLSFVLLIYSFQIFLGTPSLLLAFQIVAMGIVILCILVRAIQTRTLVFSRPFLGFFLFFLAYLAFSIIMGMERGQTPLPVLARFLQVFFTTLSVPLLAYCLSVLGIMANDKILKHIVIATLVFCAIKLAVIAAVGLLNIPVTLLDLFFVTVFGATPTFGGQAGTIFRFMAPADFLTPFILYYCIVHMKHWWRFVIVALLCVSIFSTYSRYIWLEGLFALSACCLTFSYKKIMLTLVAALMIAPIAATVLGPAIQHRFFDPSVGHSDDIRIQQSDALMQNADQTFFFGHGLGSFPYKMIRDRQAPYSYEMQWLEIIYQFGFIGLVFILGLLFSISVPLLTSRPMAALPILLLFGFFLLSGFANPSLIGRSASVGFAFVLCLGTSIRDRFGRMPLRDISLPAIETGLR